MRLGITTRSRKGGTEKTDTSKGYVKIMTNSVNNMPVIVIDSFEGYGDTYKELDEPQIRIYNKEVTLIFKGTLLELSELIDNAKKNNYV